jgi:hypothetical protein
MDFWLTVLVLFRRWYITIPAFVLSIVLAGAAYSAVPVEYQSNAVLVLTTPLKGGTETRNSPYADSLTNPMLNFDPSLALSGAIVIQQMSTSETAHRLGITFGDDTTYEVTNGSSNPELLETGPFIFIGGTGPSARAARDVATKVAAMAAVVLDERQNELHAPPSTHINVQVVVPPTAGQPLSTSPLRAAAAAGALAAMAGLAAAYGFESAMTHRRRRRSERDRAAAWAMSASTTSPGASADGGATAPGVRSRRSRLRDQQLNGTSTRTTATGAVGLLDSPGHEDAGTDRPGQGSATGER